MTDVRLPSSGNIRIRWALPNGFANWKSPTVAEANAALDIADAISWNDYGFGLEGSETTDDPSITARGNVQDRGASNFGGELSLYYPREFDDASNVYSLAYDALDKPRTLGFLLISVDGEVGENTATYTGGATRAFQAGDLVHVFKVMTDGYAESITGEEAFRYTITFLPQGDLAVNTVVRNGAVTVVVTPDAPTVTVGDSIALTGTVNGRRYTRGLRWVSSNPAAVRVTKNGVATRVATGAATITAEFEATGATDTATLA